LEYADNTAIARWVPAARSEIFATSSLACSRIFSISTRIVIRVPDSGPNAALKRYCPRMKKEERIMARGLLLWLLGVPLSVIILLALFTNIV
jgi:hypothetical protein